jgi:(4S)-4-hydroxy-5-phosphonooxypentane-2,3-dione isomerase
MMLTVIAHYRAQTGRGDDVATILARHVTPSRAEPGCVAFVAYRSTDDPDVFALYEQYVDDTAFQQHRRTAHFKKYIENGVVPLLAERAWQRYGTVEPPTV